MSSDIQTLRIDDLFVGQKFLSAEYLLEAEEIKTFARMYDPQPFHTDEEMAQKTLFRGLAASGWLTAAITMRLAVGCVPIAGGLIGTNAEMSWPVPTRAGDTLRLESEILEVTRSETHPGRGTVTAINRTLNQHGQPVQIQTVKLVIFSK